MNYGRAIRAVAAMRGLLLKVVAIDAGLAEASLSRIMRGNVPTCRTLEKISAALRIPMFLLVLLASEGSDLRALESDDAGKRLAAALMTSTDLHEVYAGASKIVREVRAAAEHADLTSAPGLEPVT